ncbi:glycosyltransferase family 4 protein [Rhodopirellula sallentina]|uniref:glycosyltransferase family 4 protein n=1 Tax=Rhodopirellula sallentina TaxID=1263869 RepID=UPI0011819036|nr:glycosyltransferase family 4 protein [Rhodopirellula sallentina]
MANASVQSPGLFFFAEEVAARAKGLAGWDRIIHRNDWYERFAVSRLVPLDESPRTLFSFSYAARLAVRSARSKGWTTVVDQIDPGPEEERIVAREHERYSQVKSSWRPAPKSYWDAWHEEMELCDRVIVNSPWSAECLRGESIDPGKIDIVPLVYVPPGENGLLGDCKDAVEQRTVASVKTADRLRILFLGQVNLRKGIGRLVDAMRLLVDDSRFELTLAGPSEIDPDLWSSLPNVHFVGPLRRSDVAAAYRAADVFILPTLSDGYALTQLEALSYGLPVIASRHCGAAVTHGENGLVLPDLEPSTIAATIVQFFESDWDLNSIVAPAFSLKDLSRRLVG